MVDYTDTLNELKMLHLKYYNLFFYLVSFLKFSKKYTYNKKENFINLKKIELKNEKYMYI